MTHTPTPWKSSGPHILARIDQTDDVVLAKTFSNGTAAFIVRAVNAHDALIKAVEIGLRYAPSEIGSGRQTMLEALKLARGEK